MMLEFIVFIAAFLFLRYIVHQIPAIYLRKRLLNLTRIKLMYQNEFSVGDPGHYRELFRETERVVKELCRGFNTVNVLYEPEKLDTNYAEMIFPDWNESYLVLGIDVIEKYRGSDLLKSLLAHEMAHYEMRHLHLTQVKIISYLYDGVYFAMFWFIYRNYSDLFRSPQFFCSPIC